MVQGAPFSSAFCASAFRLLPMLRASCVGLEKAFVPASAKGSQTIATNFFQVLNYCEISLGWLTTLKNQLVIFKRHHHPKEAKKICRKKGHVQGLAH